MFVSSLLKDLKLDFVPQKTFNDLIGIGQRKLSYDFLINDSSFFVPILIECQGEQHYYPVNYFGGKARFKRQLISDSLKRNYAIKHGFLLILISYLDFKTIHNKKLLKNKLESILSEKRKSNQRNGCNSHGGMASSQIIEI